MTGREVSSIPHDLETVEIDVSMDYRPMLSDIQRKCTDEYLRMSEITQRGYERFAAKQKEAQA